MQNWQMLVACPRTMLSGNGVSALYESKPYYAEAANEASAARQGEQSFAAVTVGGHTYRPKAHGVRLRTTRYFCM